jgi:uncharacterized protein (DUF983 family)
MAQGDLLKGLRRGLAGRCPQCGQGRLLFNYLKVQSPCPCCGHDNAQYPSDDAPPYFTILIVGHLIIAPMLCFPFVWRWPAALVLSLVMPAVAILTLLLLPRVKGAVIGVMWAIRHAEGDAASDDGAVGWKTPNLDALRPTDA